MPGEQEREYMDPAKSAVRNIWIFILGFVLIGAVHVLFYGVPFFNSIVPLIFGSLSLAWALVVRKRLVEKRTRTLLLMIAFMLFSLFMLQLQRYSLFSESLTAQRYLWYTYYIPMILIPLLVFYASLCVHRQENNPLRNSWKLLVLPAFLMILAFLTNDFHFLVFRFPDGAMTYDNEEKRLLYYVFIAWFCILMVAAFGILLKKCRLYVGRTSRLLPLCFILICLLGMFRYIMNLDLRFHGIRVWDHVEIFAFSIIGFLQICIQIGMIPANTGYEILFTSSDLPALILDSEGKAVYMTRGAGTKPMEDNQDTRIMTHRIQGGSVAWAVDLSELHELNDRLDEAIRQIEQRNDYLITENRIRQEQSELAARNDLYDRISSIVKPQLDMIEELLQDTDLEKDLFRSRLPRISVLNAYIKRRSNMELAMDPEYLPFTELVTAVSESVEYVKLCGADVAVLASGSGQLPSDLVTTAYEFFEYVVEDCLDNLSEMAVFMGKTGGQNSLSLRIMIQADDFTLRQFPDRKGLIKYNGNVALTKEQSDLIIALTLSENVHQEGGASS